VERAPFLNSLFSALPAISGSTAQSPLWPSLAPIVGGRGVYDKDSKPEEQCWATIRTAREMGAQLGSSVAFGSGCGQALPGLPRKALSKRWKAAVAPPFRKECGKSQPLRALCFPLALSTKPTPPPM